MPSNAATPPLAVLSLLLAATLWGLLWFPLRLLEARGLAGPWALLVMYAAALVPMLPAAWRRRRAARGQMLSLVLLALFAGWCNVAFGLGMIEGNVVRVMLLFYLSPVWTVLLGRLVLGEALTPSARWTLVIAVLGAVIMLWRPEAGSGWLRDRADWLGITSGLAFAAMNVVIRRTGEVPLLLKMTSAWIGVVLLAALTVAFSGLSAPGGGPTALFAAVLVGWGCIVVMTLTSQYGVTHMPVQRSAVIMLFEIVVGAASSHWIAHETIRTAEWVGGSLVVLAAWWSAQSGPRDSASQSESM